MLALRAWRSPLLVATRRPLLTAKYSEKNTILDLVGDLTGSNSDNRFPNPPAPPPGAYPAGPGLNPYDADMLSKAIAKRPKYRLHCFSSRNNTITTFTNPDGSTIAWFSGGSCGFKKGNRASYEAGYQCAVRMFKRIEGLAQEEPLELELFFKGFGQGREALHRALMTSEGENVRPLVTTITDRTPIKIGGTRAPKTRRL